mgnify:CR=1 FL=1
MNNKHDDGGAAFPATLYHDARDFGQRTGMTLRDWFAGQVLPAVMLSSDAAYMTGKRDEAPGTKEYVSDAYRIADAMIKERNRGGTE